ncbi:Protoporphyrinogen oxidase [Dyella jiangningensis]|uniref:NAD(P)/FAD-dependent oxidoreductase n=1 Tax=Dyella sp. AtDHG13 TaxID=1938897 RepID=UPI0008908EA7|nr:NAD(P)/FAD-dependent oxidoreductase [Dyella sp. AtDHG13]PXV57255.1 protoporphyrinogen oxidase [Dyella sp. AtDHG13]SDK37176.1 Protoporphyrinogen oxidase [Dyella jiangningensis]
MNKQRIAVLGAGPMGLMVAMELLKQGHDVDIYERDDRIGGMSASFNFEGLEIERYYHFICKTDFPLFQLLDELELSDRLRWTDTKMGFFYNGKLYKWGTPMALLTFDGLSLISKFRYGLHAMFTKSIKDWRPYDRMNATTWLRRWIGERAYNVLWKSLFELKLFEYSENISAAWIGTRIKRVALSRRSLMQETMGYLEGGSAVLLEKMEQFIVKNGGRIHLRSGIDRVEVRDGKVSGIVINDETISCNSVISTAPIQYVPRLVPTLPADFVERIETIKNIPVACVILKLKQPLSENFWMNINDPSIEIPGVIEYSNLNKMSPSIVYAPFYMPKTHPKWSESNETLIEEVIGYLHKLNPAFRPDWVLAKHCHRYEFAQTICPPGFYDMLPSMKTPVDGFFMADTGYYYPEDRSINESIEVAKALATAAIGTQAL